MIINKIDRHKRTVVKTAALLLYSKKVGKVAKNMYNKDGKVTEYMGRHRI